MNAPSVFFYVQHLWGVGHVYRATRVARALARHGMDVHLIWGGTEVPGFDFTGLTLHRLTPVRSRSAEFSELVHADGRPFTSHDEAERRDCLLELFHRIGPDILITEAFPFGRRQMRFELLPLFEQASLAKPKPMVVASIRDIMQEGRREKRVAESVDWVRKWFDLVLVHGDPGLIEIGETLQGTEQFASKIRYTGIVTPEVDAICDDAGFHSDVLISVGGGAFGRALLDAAIHAAPLCKSFSVDWLVATGTQMPEADFEALRVQIPEGMKLVRHIPDLAAAMRATRVSVSHAGYNTVADLLVAGCRAVLYPYTGGRETEQLRRARIMDQKGLVVAVEPGTLSPETLAQAIDRAVQNPVQPADINLEGAANSAEIIASEFEKRNR